MNIYFSKVIKAGDRQREFNFRQLSGSADNNYAVDVPDDKGQRVYFTLSRDTNGHWEAINQSLPAWLQSTITHLSTAIEEHLLQLPGKKKK